MRGMPLAGMHFIFWSDIMILQSLFLFTSSNSFCPTISFSHPASPYTLTHSHTHTHAHTYGVWQWMQTLYTHPCTRTHTHTLEHTHARTHTHILVHTHAHKLIFPHWRLIVSSYNILQYTHIYLRREREGRLCVCVCACVWIVCDESASRFYVCVREKERGRWG